MHESSKFLNIAYRHGIHFLKESLMEILERVQLKCKATTAKNINVCQILRYEERSKHCGLTTLERRRVRGELIIDVATGNGGARPPIRVKPVVRLEGGSWVGNI